MNDETPQPLSWPSLLEQVLVGQPLQPQQAKALMGAWLREELTPVQTGAFLAALRCKGLQGTELAAMAQVLQEAAVSPEMPLPPALHGELLDTCGTGGDGAGTFNISTAVAVTAAACGVPVAKHGNRSASGKVGSADVLEALGVNLKAPPAASLKALEQVGLCFLFAPGWHPALARLAPLRRSLGVRTVFNLLGPLVNPLKPAYQVLGVADAALLNPMATALAQLGVRRAVVVHGHGGLDEADLAGPSAVVHVVARDSGPPAIVEEVVDPVRLGLDPAPLTALAGGDLAHNTELLRHVLQGRGSRAQQQVVALNTGLALLAAERCASLEDGVAQALRVLASGKPWQTLQALVQALNTP
ncbi:MAG: anthranilate phosphoribosyltransferase [Synechococcus sp. SB0666_bin_14]|nr:anthranilate phosphoribosyltransferase [Synechococcus sp. SB0666_bin_14]MYA90893.1 anthranilate phosphoribosyltransferase [Synechococcus sp. SB0663_bin_10]MYG46535.1 anthranilate phosphoribosyltransferase [Synechococcus sp. SB0675_bin_6]MYJ59130.1 anthranilate phosphoribosyltransferase [Synechococcus sp. SB0672_bin_6]MYK91947.1 anthranilate phosphoribosyltransferase [Synechococcus sp. SB0669_bin_8]